MKFICPEITSNTKELYHQDALNQTVISSNNNLYYKSHYIKDSQNGTIYYYLTDTMRNILLSGWNYDGVSETPAAWLANSGYSGTDHTGYTNTFNWNTKSAMQLISGYFYTIIAEDGIHFCKPERINTSKQITVIESNITSEIDTYETSFNFEGESNSKFYIGDEKQNVTPVLIDSSMKTARLNKYKSLQNTITFQSGVDANPLDYVFRNGYYYILISKAMITKDLYLYTAVLETKDAYTFSGDDIVPCLQINDTWHYIGDPGEPAFAGAYWDHTDAATYGKVGYKKENGWLYIYGMMLNGNSGTVFTLPVGYRPIKTTNVSVVHYYGVDNPVTTFIINTDGTFLSDYSYGAYSVKLEIRIPLNKN